MSLVFPLQTVVTTFARRVGVPFYSQKLKKFVRDLHCAREIQRSALMEKIRRCEQTCFGREYGFDRIHSVSDFRRQVPISEYQSAEPYIRAVSEGNSGALFPSSDRVVAFSCTTGTTGTPKLNPITRSWLKEYRRSWEVWGVKAISDHAEMIGTKLLQLSGPADLGRSPSGLPIGMVSSVAVRFQNRLLRSFYATPFEVADIADSVSKYYTILRLSMAVPVGFIVAITPANLLRLAEVGNEYRQSLIRDIHDGTLWDRVEMTEEIRAQIAWRWKVPQPTRACELERIIEQTGTLYPKDYWPLSLISCWLGGTIGYQSRNLKQYYGSTPTRDLGLVSTEGRHSIPLSDDSPAGVLAIDGSFYEFVPVDRLDETNPPTLECDELEQAGEYSLLMTTSSGLYRYNIGDIVRCVGYLGQAPVLEFLHKIGHVSDMEGEKISGHQLTDAVDVAVRALGLRLDCFTAIPVRPEGDLPYYALLVEIDSINDMELGRRFLQLVDQDLVRQNVMYAGKRNDLYLGEPRLIRLPRGTLANLSRAEIERRGTGDSQYKQPPILPSFSCLDGIQPIDTISGRNRDETVAADLRPQHDTPLIA